MAYEHKDGKFSLFKNKYHEKGDTKPVLKGTGMWRGEIIEFAVWSKQDRDGNPFFSGTLQEPKEQPGANVAPQRKVGGISDAAMDDEIPFAPEFR